MSITFLRLTILVGGGFLMALPVQASSLMLSDSGCCSIDMSPVQVSAPVTIASFDPSLPSWIIGPSPSFYAVDFSFTANTYTCTVASPPGCAAPSVETIELDGNEMEGTTGLGDLQHITDSNCQISITPAHPSSVPYDTGICLVNSTDVGMISSAFNLSGTNATNPVNLTGAGVLSVAFQGPGNAPEVTFCAANCTATVTFYQTAADVAPEPGTVGLGLVGLALLFGLRRLRTAHH
jgi:hypothetical protein